MNQCSDCGHYRKQRPVHEALGILRIDRSQEMLKEQKELIQQYKQMAAQEYAYMQDLVAAGINDWQQKPVISHYCTAQQGKYLICEVKNYNHDCADFTLGGRVPHSCYTCIYRMQPMGVKPTHDMMGDVIQNIAIIGNDGRPSGGDFMMEKMRTLPQMAYMERAMEVSQASSLNGIIPRQPQHLAWCQAKSGYNGYHICEVVNRAEDCDSWQPRLGIRVTQGLWKSVFGFMAKKNQEEHEPVAYLKKVAKKGDADAIYSLGWLYDTGEPLEINGFEQPCQTERSTELAIKWYRKVAKKHHPEACYALGLLYYEGRENPPNYSEARRWFTIPAKQGNPHANFCLGKMYAGGLGGKLDLNSANNFFRKAAEEDHAEAQFQYAKNLLDGRGVNQNRKQAARWLFKAAEQDHVEAIYLLSTLLRLGYGIDADEEKADEYLNRAADLGHPAAIRELRRH